MPNLFNERYISREEHQEIVAYYKKLVAELHCKVQVLRKAAEASTDLRQALRTPVTEPTPRTAYVSNVINVDFRRPI